MDTTTVQFSKHLDWLSVTFPADIHHSQLFPMGEWKFVGKGAHGYQSRFLEKNSGMVSQEFSNDTTMGTHVVMSGQTLDHLRRYEAQTDEKIIEACWRLSGRPSRLDMAIDCHDVGLTASDFKYAMQGREIKTGARKWTFIEGNDDDIHGQTFYLGNRISDRFFRAYDKAAESRIKDGRAYLRLELELKSFAANGAFGAIRGHGLETAINSQFIDFMQWNNPDWCAAVCCEYAKTEPQTQQDRNTERWMYKAVLPAMARLILTNANFLSQFMQAVSAECDRITNLDIGSDNGEPDDTQ